jgi:hypothetical protein
MSPAVLLYGTGMALAAWIIHCLWWRIRRPRDDLRALAWCMAAAPVLIAVTLCAAGMLDGMAFPLALLLAEALGAAYLFWYPAAQAASPTMLIAIVAGRAGAHGFNRSALLQAISEERLTAETVDNLFRGRFARLDADGTVRLDGRGRRTLTWIRLLRRSAGLSDPKG